MPALFADEVTGRYLADIANSRPLSREREVELAALIQAGDEEARNELVKANLRFVIDVAKNYQNRGLPLADLISAGNMGLLEAAGRFDGTRGFKFISYAVWWIKQAILQAIAEQVRTVRLPINRLSVLRDITRATKKLQGESDQALDLEAVASELDLPIEEVESTLQDSHQSCSLDEAFSDDDERNLLDVLVDNTQSSPDAAVMTSSVIEVLRLELERLNEREQRILRLYYGLDGQNPITLEKIGAELGVTRERVRQLKERALAKLRHPSHSLLGEACGLPPGPIKINGRGEEQTPAVGGNGHPAGESINPAQERKILGIFQGLEKELGERPTTKEVAYESNEPEEIVGIVLASQNLAT